MILSQFAVRVTEVSQTGESRRLAALLAEQVNFDAEDAGRLAIIVTEAARNLAKFGRDGELLLRAVSSGWRGVEILAVDRGPGMKSPAECLRDGYSTAGTPGTGLGAIRRMSDVFDLYTQPERGTVLLAQVRARGSTSSFSLQMGAVSLPLRGEQVSGDQWAIREHGRLTQLIVADGVGHGAAANAVALQAINIFQEDSIHRPPPQLLHDIHLALKSTRGAAVGVAELHLDTRQVNYSAVGNVAGAVLTPSGARMMIYHNGTVGHQFPRKAPDLAYTFPPNATLVMFSDGISSWSLDHYPGLLARHPGIVAAVLYRDFRRGRDDVTVITAREVQG